MMVDVSRLKHKPSDMGWRVGDQVGVATTTRLNANDAEVYVSNLDPADNIVVLRTLMCMFVIQRY